MEKAPDQSVFIGKPCDVAGLRPAHNINPQLAQKTALSIELVRALRKFGFEVIRTKGSHRFFSMRMDVAQWFQYIEKKS
jgi:hypothetical protein